MIVRNLQLVLKDNFEIFSDFKASLGILESFSIGTLNFVQ